MSYRSYRKLAISTALMVLTLSAGVAKAANTAPDPNQLRFYQRQISLMNGNIQQEQEKISHLSGQARDMEMLQLQSLVAHRTIMIQMINEQLSQPSRNVNCTINGQC